MIFVVENGGPTTPNGTSMYVGKENHKVTSEYSHLLLGHYQAQENFDGMKHTTFPKSLFRMCLNDYYLTKIEQNSRNPLRESLANLTHGGSMC